MLTSLQAPLDNIQQADPTDPNPPPQAPSDAPTQDPTPATAPATDAAPVPTPAPSTIPEHLSTIAPGIATPAGASTRPNSMPPQPPARPDKPVAHGGPTRQYLNTNITPHLLEGMKYLAAHEPAKPLEWLGDFLKERSKEVEG